LKNIIQITLAIVVFLLLIFVVKNTFFKEKNCLENYPEIIKKYNLEGKYDTARWVLYALNSADEHSLSSQTTIDSINENYDIAHCWLKQYYKNHKKINRVQ